MHTQLIQYTLKTIHRYIIHSHQSNTDERKAHTLTMSLLSQPTVIISIIFPHLNHPIPLEESESEEAVVLGSESQDLKLANVYFSSGLFVFF